MTWPEAPHRLFAIETPGSITPYLDVLNTYNIDTIAFSPLPTPRSGDINNIRDRCLDALIDLVNVEESHSIINRSAKSLSMPYAPHRGFVDRGQNFDRASVHHEESNLYFNENSIDPTEEWNNDSGSHSRKGSSEGVIFSSPLDFCEFEPLINSNRSGFWTRISEVPALDLREQLALLMHIITKVKPRKQKGIMDFAFAALPRIGSPAEYPSRIQRQLTIAFLGKLSYFCDRKPRRVAAFIKEHSVDEAIRWVNNSFVTVLKRVADRLLLHKDRHAKTLIHDPEISMRTLTPIEMSHILVTKKGFINLGLIDVLLNCFIQEGTSPQNFESSLMYGLKVLRHSESFRRKVCSVTKPVYEFMPAHYLIMILFSLDPKESITDAIARKTALSGILSHLRQGPVGSCFATHYGIILLSSHLELCLKDFDSLLKESKLSCIVDHNEKEFPLLLRMGDNNLSKQIKINRSGRLSDRDEEAYIYECPGIIAACQSLEIEDHKGIIEIVIRNIFDSDEQNPLVKEISIQHLLKQLSFFITKYRDNPSDNNNVNYSKASFAFDSQTSNPLLRVWENSLASMSEGNEGSMIRAPIFNAITTSLTTKIKEILAGSIFELQIPKLQQAIRKELSSRIQLFYDPNIENDSLDDLHSTNEGGFILYDKNWQTNPNRWERVTNPQKFQHFIIRAMKSVYEKTRTIESESISAERLESFFERLCEYVNTDAFILKTLELYFPPNLRIADPVKNWRQLRYTPWRTISGNVAEKVKEVHQEETTRYTMRTLNPQKVGDLLATLIGFLKNLPDEQRMVYQKNPYKRIPLYTPTHAFSLLLGHPSMMHMAQERSTTEEAIETLLRKGCLVSQSIVDERTRRHLIDFAANRLISPAQRRNFLNSINKYDGQPLSYFILRRCIKKLIAILDRDNVRTISERIHLFDTELCDYLPTDLKKILERSIVQFADTNWLDGIHDLRLAIGVAPWSNELAILQCCDNGTKIQPVKQAWLLTQEWKIYEDPHAALPKDTAL